MRSACYDIAGLHLAVDQTTALPDVPMPSGFAVFESQSTADVHFHLVEHLPPTGDARPLYKCLAVDGLFECLTEQTADALHLILYNTRARSVALRLLWNIGSDCADIECHDASALRFALWMGYTFVGAHRGRVPVHAATIVNNQKAILLLGESGTGKSTHAQLWMEHIEGTTLLNDDSPILRLQPDGLTVCGSPWSGKGACYRTAQVPLAAIVRLSQASTNSMRRLNAIEAFAAVQPSFPPAAMSTEWLADPLFDLLDSIVRTIPVYSLRCRPDREAAQLAFDTVCP
ncbi:MAG: hypothetical protein IJV22_07190 [Bacteroidales bacterium]|nr:hypothetical protein [Bacteroidales bacterium]